MKLGPGIQRFIQHMESFGSRGPHWTRMSIHEQRARATEARQELNRGGPQVLKNEYFFAANRSRIRCRETMAPARTPLAALVFFHGGGWTIGSIDTHDRLMREYASRSPIAVIGVDYSLSPEALFPQALEECSELVDNLSRFGTSFVSPGTPIVFGGDSSGANIALALAMWRRDRKLLMPCALLLNYGAFTDDTIDWSYEAYGKTGPILTADRMAFFWSNYLPNRSHPDRGYACPLEGNLSGLPPAFIAVAEHDILTAQNHLLAKRLRSAGCDVSLRTYQGTVHAFLEAVAWAPVSETALNDQAAWLVEKLILRP